MYKYSLTYNKWEDRWEIKERGKVVKSFDGCDKDLAEDWIQEQIEAERHPNY